MRVKKLSKFAGQVNQTMTWTRPLIDGEEQGGGGEEVMMLMKGVEMFVDGGAQGKRIFKVPRISCLQNGQARRRGEHSGQT